MDRFIKAAMVFLLLNVVYVFGANCGNGATCIVFSECKGLQSGIQDGKREFRSLFRKLHCGYDSLTEAAMVCCPPEFLHSLPPEALQIDDSNLTTNLLPNVLVCGFQNSDTDRIHGRSRTLLEEHSWLALIRYDKPRGSGFYCGGVLISSRYVLTAAHCIKGLDIPSDWIVSQVRLGEWNTSSNPDCDRVECAPPVIDVDVEEVIPHSQYNPLDNHQLNDIALLRLARDVPFTDFVKPICLPNSATLRNATFEGQMALAVGWGKTDTRSTSKIKLQVRVPVVEQSVCRNVYKRATRMITASQLCAGSNDGDGACGGDSGGPLLARISPLYNWMVIGVESYGPTPCEINGWPRVYTRITEYMEWIVNNMRP